MTGSWQEEISQLLQQCFIGFLASTGEHGAEASMAPFAIDRGNIILHLSQLARHSKNILNQPDVGFMICTPEIEKTSPLALPRLSIQGKVEPVPNAYLDASKEAYLKRIPDAEQLFTFADFSLFQIVVSHIQWVGGFGSSRKVTLASWNQLASRQGTLK